MKKRVLIRALIHAVCLFLLASHASADNTLGIAIDKYRTLEDSFRYEFGAGFNKEGASSCKLTNPTGTYDCFEMGGEWYPDTLFWQEHTQMSFSEVLAAVGDDWTIVWDEGQETETAATVTFGTLIEDDFLEVPEITHPADGSGDISQDTSIDWNYGGTDPCTAQIDMIEVLLSGSQGSEIESDELPCTTLSWMPSTPLDDGEWGAVVSNAFAFRDVPEGLDISGDAWNLDNTDWLDLRSIDTARFWVGPVAIQNTTIGSIKLLYR
jgi:hypothetical protein